MLIYTLIMLIVSLICLILGMLIHSGNTDLIHAYHRKNVKDFKGYSKAMGGCVMALSAIHLVSGLIVMIWKTQRGLISSLIFYAIFFLIFLIAVVRVQKKYNGKFIS